MNDEAPVLILDLDGTILRVNSFPRWILFLIMGAIPNMSLARRVLLSARVQLLLCRRKLGRLAHVGLRHELRRAWRAATRFNGDAMAVHFQSSLCRLVRPNLRPLLDMIASGQVDAILATAAPAEYAAGLGRQLGFPYVLAATGRRANIGPGQRKFRQVGALLAARAWQGRRLILFTDHIDDLPLMRRCDVVCWFGPEQRLAAARAQVDARFILCRPLDGEDIAAVLRAHGLHPAGQLADSSFRFPDRPPTSPGLSARTGAERRAEATPRGSSPPLGAEGPGEVG
jgi:phosphoserine phosphatase